MSGWAAPGWRGIQVVADGSHAKAIATDGGLGYTTYGFGAIRLRAYRPASPRDELGALSAERKLKVKPGQDRGVFVLKLKPTAGSTGSNAAP